MCDDCQPRCGGMTFCARARRLLVIFFIVLAAAEVTWGTHLPISQAVQSGRHLLLAVGFTVVAGIIFAFDWWWELRNTVEDEDER